MNDPHLITSKVASFFKNSVTFKILSIFFLILILLIPTSMVESVISERQYRKNDVVSEISSKWGQAQLINGPFITIPYRKYFEDKKGKQKYIIKYMHFLPDELNIDGKILPQIRYRGIYQAVLYNADLKIFGKFPKLPIEELNVPEENILWNSAYMALGISDMSGIRDEISAKINNQTVIINPGLDTTDIAGAGVNAKLSSLNFDKSFSFNMSLNLNGSYKIQFIPSGRQTNVSLNSPWNSPSFDGEFLPVSRNINSDGFKAQWKVLHLNRNFPQYWIGSKHQVSSSAFGVRLFVAVDIYQKATRTAKYAVMFIIFTFMTFFFSEIMHKDRLHPIQYLLVGMAVIIFYTLLISISEHLNFDTAYVISSIATITLVTGYSRSILKNRYMSFTIGGILVILYGYLYMVLQQEDYALLMGSIGLFAVLSIVMYMTRKIDWYSVNSSS